MILVPKALTARAFAPYGQVAETANAKPVSINRGLTTRYHELFTVDVSSQGGYPIGNIFRTAPLPLPHRVTVMERHPLGSQAFIPLQAEPFLVLVAGPGDSLRAEDLELFLTNGEQGINLFRNTWHHFNIVIESVQEFLVVDRGGPGENLEETGVVGEAWIERIKPA